MVPDYGTQNTRLATALVILIRPSRSARKDHVGKGIRSESDGCGSQGCKAAKARKSAKTVRHFGKIDKETAKQQKAFGTEDAYLDRGTREIA
jgi:hypothetical protein